MKTKYSISAAARELGCSIYFLRKLDPVIQPERLTDTVGTRVYTDDDLRKVLGYVERRGGIRDAVALKRAVSAAIRQKRPVLRSTAKG